jgi:hypothetical protein
MRLINTNTLELCLVSSDNPPRYAILSHTWGSDEVEFAQYYEQRTTNSEGYRKIQGACRQASNDGFKYLWIDTCCIDKSSSSELSEAINSMFRWYTNSEVCYAYLSDVSLGDQDLKSAKWWSRGWTLQELLAPSAVVFLDKFWRYIGGKTELSQKIENITGIDSKALQKFHPDDWSIAQRMSWASSRQTTRAEDIAYSLMGIFGVHMPLLYGEGAAAFARLQEEIVKTTDDQTIFAYGCLGNADPLRNSDRNLFAGSPACFQGRTLVHPLPALFTDRSHAMTNKGLQIELPLIELPFRVLKELSLELSSDKPAKLGILACSKAGNDLYYGIVLLQTDRSSVYDRFACQPIHVTPEQALAAQISQIYIRRKGRHTDVSLSQKDAERFCIVTDYEPLKSLGYQLRRCVSFRNPWSSLDSDTGTLSGTSLTQTLPAISVFYSEHTGIAIPIRISVESIQEPEDHGREEAVAVFQPRAFLQILKIREQPGEPWASDFLDSIVQDAWKDQIASGTTISAVRIKDENKTAGVQQSLEIVASIHTDVKLNRVVITLSLKVEKIIALRSLPA